MLQQDSSTPGPEAAAAPGEKRRRSDADTLAVTMAHVLDGTIAPEQFETAHVRDVYNAIAPHFSATRYKPWPRIQTFVQSLPPYTLIADIGCGNGKYFGCAHQRQEPAPLRAAEDHDTTTPSLVSSSSASPDTAQVVVVPTQRYVLGLDNSEALLRQTQRSSVDPNFSAETRVGPVLPPPPPRSIKQARAQARRAALREARELEVLPRTDVVASEAQRCPLRGGLFDAVLSVAVVHHYATHTRRVTAVAELLRLARPEGGQVLIYVWAYEQPVEKQRARGVDLATGDAMVKWELNAKFDPEKTLFHRFYHFFREGELESLCLEAAQNLGVTCRVVESWYDHENWCVRLERTS